MVRKIFDVCKFGEDFNKIYGKIRAYLHMSKKITTFAAAKVKRCRLL